MSRSLRHARVLQHLCLFAGHQRYNFVFLTEVLDIIIEFRRAVTLTLSRRRRSVGLHNAMFAGSEKKLISDFLQEINR